MKLNTDKEQLKNYFNRYVDFSNTAIDEIYTKLESKTFQKQEYILQQGQICKSKYFIISGLIRSFHIDHKGNEKITQFALENWWLTNMESYITQTPSRLYIQAIEKTQLLLFNKDVLEELYFSIPQLERFFRIVTENMLIANKRRHDFYLQMKSKDRYHGFINFFPKFYSKSSSIYVSFLFKNDT
ncbi:Crp/Fnr family transcriptional regulator [Flavivirga jejuensis]|uniref:Cyclic nucleotide-binding domain-containing protein n=1 Tax=Flavivirga jejuensis TaxID=870487 RepID=A0ABT8WT42_9FLAO|nr:cyclic nucleotide-binding domain-containing protein [Flavivirga jejuensis]MDO5976339.1 cyclic nucleotide-binding domain-containing protein [Flavivirga jejuensis]